MPYTVEFPGLGLTLNVNRVAFTLFGVEIYWYGVLIGLGLVLAMVMAFRQAKSFGIDADRMIDVIIVGFFCALIGGRLYYLAFIDQSYRTFFEIIDLRGGGIAIYGAIIGAFVGAGLACKWRKVPLRPLFDLAGMGFLIGQSIGRWGNFFNQEAFGTNTTLPWGMYSEGTYNFLSWNQQKLAETGMMVDPALPVHPTFLYESLWCALGFLLLFLYRKRRKFNGELFLFYVAWYGFGRFFIEGLRTDALRLKSGIPVSQIVAAITVLAALALWVAARVKTHGKPLVVPAIPPRTARVKLETADGPQVVLISWPGGEPEPGRAEKQEMARKQLEEKAEEAKAEKEENSEPGAQANPTQKGKTGAGSDKTEGKAPGAGAPAKSEDLPEPRPESEQKDGKQEKPLSKKQEEDKEDGSKNH